MTSFVHRTLPQTVVLDTGRAAERLTETVAGLGVQRIALISSSRGAGQAGAVAAGLDVVLHWTEVAQHVPVELAERARAAVREADAQVLVCVGGGSVIGLAKAVALTSGLPIIALPTTFAGSEATRMWGLTQDGTKTTGLDDRVLPRTVIHDAELVSSLPVPVAVASGFNALAHCVDSMWAPATDPIAQALALEGARVLAEGLRGLVTAPEDLTAREQCLSGSYLAAVSFATAGSGLHHKICHVLGGSFGLPHAQTHAVVLPHVLALNAPAVPQVARRIARALDAEATDAGAALASLRAATGAPRSLRELGMPHDGLDEAARRVLEVAPPSNPAPVDGPVLTALLRAAWAG